MKIAQAGSHSSSSLFLMLYRTNPNGTTQPVYKSENQRIGNGAFKFVRVFSDTDTLANSMDASEIFVKIYRYDKSGNHKCAFTQKMQLQALNIAAVEQ